MRICVAILFVVSFAGSTTAQAPSTSAQSGAPLIGLQIGERAPAFSAVDQFGHEQTNETLRGTHGSVLLLFRSADW